MEPAANKRKRREKGKDPSEEAAGVPGLAWRAQHMLLDLELWGAEVYQQAVLNAGRTQITQELGHLFVCLDSSILRLLRLFVAEMLFPPVPLPC